MLCEFHVYVSWLYICLLRMYTRYLHVFACEMSSDVIAIIVIY